MRRMATALALLTAAALALSACSGGSESGGDGEGAAELNIGIAQEVASWDPATAPAGPFQQQYQAAYDTLIKRAPDGTFEPMLATAWEWNEDATDLTLTLRDDVTFNDGTPFDSSAVAANFENLAANSAPFVAVVESVDTPDPTTAVIHLTGPDPSFLIQLTRTLGFMGNPASFGTDALAQAPDGTGPYLLDVDRTTVGSHYTFVKREDYWGEDLPFDTIVFRFYADQTAKLNALKTGQIDTANFDAESSAGAEAAGLDFFTTQIDWSGASIYDRAGSSIPALGDVRVRQALNYAIDKEAMLDAVLQGGGTLTSQVWGPGSQGYLPELEDYYEYDLGKAKELMAEAGYEDGFSATVARYTVQDRAGDLLLQQMWEEIGVTIEYVDMEAPDLIAGIRGAEYPLRAMFNYPQSSDWMQVRYIIAPDASWNPFHSTDDVTEQLIADYLAATDESEQTAVAQELNTHIVEQAWFAPVYRIDARVFWDDAITVTPQAEEVVPSIYNYQPAD